MAHNVYDDMFAIIVRPNKNMKHLNEEFVVKDLCKGKSISIWVISGSFGVNSRVIWAFFKPCF